MVYSVLDKAEKKGLSTIYFNPIEGAKYVQNSQGRRGGGDKLTSVRYRRASSAYNIFSSITVTPLTESSALIMAARGSIASANRPGGKGQPCLVPLPREKGRDSELFMDILGQNITGKSMQ